MKILIVEDNDGMRSTFEALLGGAYSTVSVSSLQNALQEIKRDDFDVVLTDWDLGDEVSKELVDMSLEKGARVIIHTGTAEKELSYIKSLYEGRVKIIPKGINSGMEVEASIERK